jgi:uncharacterized protein YndB with AHSA1/START domain
VVIEETVVIHADVEKVWDTFTDLSYWKNWNTALEDVKPSTGKISEGRHLSCRMRPFAFPLHFDPVIREVVRPERVVWSGGKYGIRARHEFIFKKTDGDTTVTSRETFRGLPVIFQGLFFPAGRIRELTVIMLRDLKRAAEE